MKRLAAVYGGSAPHHRTLNEPKYRRCLSELIYLPDLPHADLSRVDGLLIPERLHQGKLGAAADQVLGFLESGGCVIAFGGGEHPPSWLPGLIWEPRPTNFWWWLEPGATGGLSFPHPVHSLFRFITPADATWHYHGVLHPPPGAEVLIGLEEGGAVCYLDRESTPGTLLVAALDPISHFGSYFMPASERFLDGFLPWVVWDLLETTPANPLGC
ncbi:MAG: hypothetical protein ACRDJG_07955 [Actinomycetota bacterium]